MAKRGGGGGGGAYRAMSMPGSASDLVSCHQNDMSQRVQAVMESWRLMGTIYVNDVIHFCIAEMASFTPFAA